MINYFFFFAILTLFVYGAFPIFFALTRRKMITKKLYRILGYVFNFVIMFFLNILGIIDSTSIIPYFIWTWFFIRWGLKILENRCVLKDYQADTSESQTNSKHINSYAYEKPKSNIVLQENSTISVHSENTAEDNTWICGRCRSRNLLSNSKCWNCENPR